MTAHVAVVGGGLAGLSAAVACADAGVRVTLFEARPRLGGATWSTRHHGLEIDNGQHVFLRCCDAYLGFLRRLGAAHRVEIQPRLSLPVLAPGRPASWLRRHPLPAPAHLLPSLARYRHLTPRQRWRVARTARRLGGLELADPALDGQRFGDWLTGAGESPESVAGFWDLLIRPTLNTPAAEASLALAAKVFQTGLLARASGADVGYAREPLARVHAEPAAAVLRAAGARVCLRSPVEHIDCNAQDAIALRAAGARVAADAVILAAPHDRAAALLPPQAGVDTAGLRRLGHSPIVNLHVVFDRPVLGLPFAAGLDTPLEWIFDRTRASGLERGQYLAVSLSAAERWVGRSREALRAAFLPAFAELLPAARRAQVLAFFATCERAATFRQVPGTRALRPPTRTAHPRLHLAGAWTDTGWPATMEGAVRSGLAAAASALAAIRPRRAPARAA